MHPNHDDFAERYRAHHAQVIGVCRRLLGSAEQAEDAAHEVFLRAHTRHGDFDAGRPFSNWILSIASHYCIDVLRRRSTEARLFGTEEVERAGLATDRLSPLGALIVKERRQEMRGAVAALPAKYRVPLVLAFYNELTYDEIGAMLGVQRTHVAVLIFRAKQQLRRSLSPRTDAHRRGV